MPIDISQLAYPQVSAAGARALEIIHQDEPDLSGLQTILSRDPVLAGVMIRHANSPLYRRSHEITNIPAAIRVLGIKSIRSAVVMATLHGSDVVTPANQSIWDHCQATAIAARTIAEQINTRLADDVEFIGLIHDIGMLVLSNHAPDQYQELIHRSTQEQVAIDQLEMEFFGLQHGTIMNRFYEEFRLPDAMVNLLWHFHNHDPIDVIDHDYQHRLSILELSHHLLASSQMQRFTPATETIIESPEHLQIALGINEEIWATINQTLAQRLSNL